MLAKRRRWRSNRHEARHEAPIRGCATQQECEQLRRVAGRVVNEEVPTFRVGAPGEDDGLLKTKLNSALR